MKKLLLIPLLFLTSCIDVFKEEIHTIEECRNFKKGDTILTREFYTIKKCIVLENYPDKNMIEVRDLRYEWDVNILFYNDFRFK